MTCALMVDPAARRASQSGSSLTTERRLLRIVVVALPRLRRNWLLDSAVLAAWGNIGRDLDAITRPRFPYEPGFLPGGRWLHRCADDAILHRCASGRRYRRNTGPMHRYPARSAFWHRAWPVTYRRS